MPSSLSRGFAAPEAAEGLAPPAGPRLAARPSAGLGRPLAAALAVLAWAAVVWRLAFVYTTSGRALGYDLLFSWHAEKVFAAGGKPYAVSQFVYPPSLLLLFRPIAGLSQHAVVLGGEIAVMVVAVAGVAVTACALGLRWWGPVAAISTLLLTFTGAMVFELRLENLSVLEFLALAAFLLLAVKDRWMAAAVVLGLSLAVKPMLVPLLLLLVLGRRWKPLAVAVGLPALLNLIAVATVNDPSQVLGKLPFLVDRTGRIVAFNSAWVDVARELGMPDVATVLLRVCVGLLAVAASWLAWTRLADPSLRLTTTASALLLGTFTVGTLSEYHFMLTMVPLAMTVAVGGSPVRFPLAWLGLAWTFDAFQFAVFGLRRDASDSALRAIGMSVVLLTITGVLLLRQPVGRAARSLRLRGIPAITV